MLLRRTILILMLIALALCAIAGMLTVFADGPRQFEPIIHAAIAITIAMGALLALTLLIDRPNYRFAATGAMVVIVLALLSYLGICVADTDPYSSRYVTLNRIFYPAFTGALLLGIPTAAAMFLNRFPWSKVAIRALIIAAIISAQSVFACIILSTGLFSAFAPTEESEKFLTAAADTYLVGVLIALLLVNADRGDRRYFRYPALLLALFVLVDMYFCIANSSFGTRFVPVSILLPPVIFFAHLNLLLMAKPPPTFAWIKWTTVAFSAISAFCAMYSVFGLHDQTWTSYSIAAAIAAGSGSVALIALSLLHRRFDYRELTQSPLLQKLQLTCPRCQKSQTLPLGNSACQFCNLKLSIRATEPQCLQCGYLLYGISSMRCPECGADTDRELDISPAIHIKIAVAADK